MFYLKINKNKINVKDQSISLSYYNPMLYTQGSFSLPFSINLFSANQKHLGFPNRTERKPDTVIETTGILNGNPVFEGYLNLLQSSEYSEASLLLGNSYFYTQIANQKLNQLDIGYISLGTTFANLISNMNAAISLSYPDSEYTAFPFIYESYSEINANYNGIFNDFDRDTQGFFNDQNKRPVTVFLYLGSVLERLFSSYGYSVTSNDFKTNARLKKITLGNKRKLNSLYVNGLAYNLLLPDVNVSDFLSSVQNMFNVAFNINEADKSVKIIYVENIFSKIPKINLTNKQTSKPIIYHKDESISLSVPDQKTFEPNFSYNSVDTFQDLPTPTDASLTTYVRAEEAYYISVEESSTYVWKLKYSYYHKTDETTGNVLKKDIGAKIPLPKAKYEYIDDSGAQEQITRWRLLSDVDDCDFFFLIYHGLQPEGSRDYTGDPPTPLPSWAQPKNYPFATSGKYDTEYNIVSDFDFSINNDMGLKAIFYKNFAEWLEKRQLIEFFLDLPAEIIYGINFTEPVRIGNQNYIIDSYEIEYENDRIKVSSFKAYTI